MEHAKPPQFAHVAGLRDLIHRVEEQKGAGGGDGSTGAGSRVPIGIASIDAALGGGLEAGAIHEVVGHMDQPVGDRVWSPPLGWVTHLARAMARDGWIVWVGMEVAPYPQALGLDRGAGDVLRRSVFVDAVSSADRLWSADVALRSGGDGVACVVVDARRFDMGATRRLQLGARRGRAVGVLVRPPEEVHALSVATTRWTTRRRVPAGGAADPGWTVELVRCKGVQPSQDAPRSWGLEWCCATCDVGLGADVVDRSGPAPEAEGPGRAQWGGIARSAS